MLILIGLVLTIFTKTKINSIEMIFGWYGLQTKIQRPHGVMNGLNLKNAIVLVTYPEIK